MGYETPVAVHWPKYGDRYGHADDVARWGARVRLARLARQPTTDVMALGRVEATDVGRLLAANGTSDITGAHVVLCARRSDQPVVTSDPDVPSRSLEAMWD